MHIKLYFLTIKSTGYDARRRQFHSTPACGIIPKKTPNKTLKLIFVPIYGQKCTAIKTLGNFGK